MVIQMPWTFGAITSPYYPLANEVAKGYSNATFSQNPLKNVDSRVFTRMLHGKKFTK
jgi:hypothetical protein